MLGDNEDPLSFSGYSLRYLSPAVTGSWKVSFLFCFLFGNFHQKLYTLGFQALTLYL